MCEYCDQLQRVLTPSPVTACPACARPLSATDKPHTCSRCVLYALIHQNTFAQRWDDIQLMITTPRPQQIHASLNTPQPVTHKAPLPVHENPSVSSIPPNTITTRQHPIMVVDLALTSHTTEAIQQFITAHPAAHRCTTTHISHPTWPLTLTQLHLFNGLKHSSQDQVISHPVLFHHLRITAISALTPRDRTLKITLANTIHIMTPPRTGSVATPHHLHLFLDPHDRTPYLQHICTGHEPAPYRLIIATSLPTPRSASAQARRRPMLRTTAHAPDLVTTLTFPADSAQHQQSILTLATHLLLTVPIITRQQSWNIIREKDTHRHNLQLMLATITLKRSHLVWHTIMTGAHTLKPQQQTTTTMTHTKRHTPPPPPRNPPTKRQRHAQI